MTNPDLSPVGVYYPPQEKDLIRTAAGISGMSMGRFVREAGLDRARKIVEEFRHASERTVDIPATTVYNESA